MQARQWPQRMIDSTATRSPTSTPQRFAARSPMRSITPSGSWPGTTGRRTGRTPAYCSASLPQMPHASTRRSALSSSISGTGSSRSSRRRGAVCTTTRLVRMAHPSTAPPAESRLAPDRLVDDEGGAHAVLPLRDAVRRRAGAGPRRLLALRRVPPLLPELRLLRPRPRQRVSRAPGRAGRRQGARELLRLVPPGDRAADRPGRERERRARRPQRALRKKARPRESLAPLARRLALRLARSRVFGDGVMGAESGRRRRGGAVPGRDLRLPAASSRLSAAALHILRRRLVREPTAPPPPRCPEDRCAGQPVH